MVDDSKSAPPRSSGSSPAWLDRYLHADSHERISTAVRAAERMTSGEIVPMVVRASSATGHVGIFCGLILLFLYFALGLDHYVATIPGPTLVWELSLYLMALVIGQNLAKLRALQSLLTTPRDKHTQVMRRAQLAFHQAGLENTRDSTGVLLFLSIMERQAVVLADKGIAAKLPPETWNEVTALLMKGMAQYNLGAAMEPAIKRCGELLAAHFPPTAVNPDELSNDLRVQDS